MSTTCGFLITANHCEANEITLFTYTLDEDCTLKQSALSMWRQSWGTNQLICWSDNPIIEFEEKNVLLSKAKFIQKDMDGFTVNLVILCTGLQSNCPSLVFCCISIVHLGEFLLPFGNRSCGNNFAFMIKYDAWISASCIAFHFLHRPTQID